MRNVHRLTEGAIILAIFVILLLITIYVPILGTVVNFFLALPFMMFAAKNNRKDAAVFLIASLLLSLLVGTLLAIPLTLAYGLTGIVIGDFIRNGKSRNAALIAGSLTFLLNLVLQYVISILFFNLNFIEESILLLRESIDQSISMITRFGQEPNEAMVQQLYSSIDLIGTLIPTLFVLFSFLIVIIIQLVSYPILKRFGLKVALGSPFRSLKLPRSILYYFLIAFLASWIIQPEPGSYFHLALSNISYILQLLIIVQGLSFIWFISYHKKWSKAVPVLATVTLFLMPMALYIIWILGIIDLGLDLRKNLIH
ncbi:YybS family protein [Niallia sp. Krafla_26]|uniref:YybS family protein n=1 Tax=Niallia sp. Krafla_26 TaxID=3064703 RepID=UPI003D184487